MHDARAGGPEGMAEGDGAAVDVEAAGVHLAQRRGAAELLRELGTGEGLEVARHLRGEGLVHLDQVDVRRLIPARSSAIGAA